MESDEFDFDAYLQNIKKQAEEHERIGNEFARKMMQGMIDLDPEFSKTLDENLWELLEE